MILDSIQIILLFGAIAFCTNWAAWKLKFYRLPKVHYLDVPFKEVAGVFAIYVGIMVIVAPWLIKQLVNLSYPSPPPIALTNFLQLLILAILVVALILFCHFEGQKVTVKIWKDRELPHSKPFYTDFMIGILVWFMSFPVVGAIGQFLDLLIYLFVGVENYEQVAVRYLRNTLGSPSQVFIALMTILFVAPIIEEFIFRGCLQTFFKKHLGRKAAILLASLCFALFHFSPSQGLGNISLIPTLFVFAGFLGYVYERQGSLFASIGLHVTFNLASALRILFSSGGG